MVSLGHNELMIESGLYTGIKQVDGDQIMNSMAHKFVWCII